MFIKNRRTKTKLWIRRKAGMENLELAIQGEIHTGTWSTAKMLSGRFALCWSHCHGSHTDKNRYYITAHAAYMRGSQTVAIFWDLTSKSKQYLFGLSLPLHCSMFPVPKNLHLRIVHDPSNLICWCIVLCQGTMLQPTVHPAPLLPATSLW